LDEFTVFFNRKKQWFKVFLWDVNPGTFANWGGGRWAYWEAKWENPKQGFFGEFHAVKSRVNREDLVAHELLHVLFEWIRAREIKVSTRNEERLVTLFDEITRNFYRAYRKSDGK
jgi:hypothetical protein